MEVIISCYIGHVFEALFEKLERWMYREDADNDPLYTCMSKMQKIY